MNYFVVRNFVASMSGYKNKKEEEEEDNDELDEGEEYSKYKAGLKQDLKQICKLSL